MLKKLLPRANFLFLINKLKIGKRNEGYFTVTDFARFLGMSGLKPFSNDT